uniref:Uncharacterized protein n=1 Tax=Cacopsylla melanoneura TaxID=428564 RepID=A0A8D8UY51_9HEMI
MLVCFKTDYNNHLNPSSFNMTSENAHNNNPYKCTRKLRPVRRVKHEEQGSSTPSDAVHMTNGFGNHDNTLTDPKLASEVESTVSNHQNHNKSNLNSKPAMPSIDLAKSEQERVHDYTRHLLNRNFQLEKNDSASEFVRAIISAVDDMNDHTTHRKLHPKHEEKVHGAKKHTKHKSSDQTKRKAHTHKEHTHPGKNQNEPNACNHNEATHDVQNNNHHDDKHTGNHNHRSVNNENTHQIPEPHSKDTLKQNLETKQSSLTNGIPTNTFSNLMINKRPVPSPKTNRRLLNSKRVLNQVPENENTGETQASSKYSSLIRYLNNVPEHEHHEEQNNQDEDSKLNKLSSDRNELNPDSAKNHSLEVLSHENSQNSSEKSNREDHHEGVESNWQPAVTDRHTEEGLDEDKTSQHVPLMFQRRRRSRNEEYCRVRSSDGRPLTASEMRYYRRRPIISPADSRSTNTSIDDDSNNSRTRRRRPVQPWHHIQTDSDCALQRRMLHNAIQQKAASVRILKWFTLNQMTLFSLHSVYCRYLIMKLNGYNVKLLLLSKCPFKRKRY